MGQNHIVFWHTHKTERSQSKLGHMHVFLLDFFLFLPFPLIGFSPVLPPILMDSPHFWARMVASCAEHLLEGWLFPSSISHFFFQPVTPLFFWLKLKSWLEHHHIAPLYSRAQHLSWKLPHHLPFATMTLLFWEHGISTTLLVSLSNPYYLQILVC